MAGLDLCPSVAAPDVYSVKGAAGVLGMSTSWIRDRITDRSLAAVASPAAPTLITARSVMSLRDRRRAAARSHRVRTNDSGHLTLVVDNT